MIFQDETSAGGEHPPGDFVEAVRQSLEHVHDLPYLQGHRLRLPGGANVPELSGQRLRREILAAVESLSPGPGVPFRAPHARLYNVLHLHYVEGMTVQEAAHELNISGRQAYRDLRHGEESVAAALWDRLSRPGATAEGVDDRVSSPRSEIDRLVTRDRPVDARSLIERAIAAVERLARARGVTFGRHLPDHPLVVSADPAAGPQVLISLFSQAAQQAAPGEVAVDLASSAGEAVLSIVYRLPGDAAQPVQASSVVSELANRLGWGIAQADTAGPGRTITLRMPSRCATVLVIDDNKGLGELIERYLAGYACRVVQATRPDEGQRLAVDLGPDLILLDVMMPDIDGWQVLQTLKNQPATTGIPIVVCSVFDDPELAYSLGANLFLPKPVNRDSIVGAVRELRIV